MGKHPRLQLVTVKELLEGRKLDLPPVTGVNVTLKAAKKATLSEPAKIELDLSTPAAKKVAEAKPEDYPTKPKRGRRKS